MARRAGVVARLLGGVLMAGLVACGGHTPTSPTTPNRWMLDVLVTTENGTPIAGATLRIVDGPNAGQTAKSGDTGHAVFSSLQQSGFTVEVSAPFFATTSLPVSLTSAVSTSVKLPLQPVANEPPNVTLAASSARAETDAGVDITATVTDDVTPVNQLQYQWTASIGTIAGAGPSAHWQAPHSLPRPTAVDVTLTVVETFTVIDVNGASQPRENRTSATAVIHVNDSYAEVRDLTLTFLEDFSHSAVPPATCVRNFSDSCAGKAAELDDIADNRNRYVIQSSSFSFGTVTFNPDRTYADITAPCQFTSLQIKDTLGNPTNLVVTVKGTCILTAVYEQWHWWLCDSHFRETVAPFNSGFRF